MSNTRHARVLAPIPGKPGPVTDGPSLIRMIADAFAVALDRHHFMPGCNPCVAVAKNAEHQHGIAVGNARAAAESEPVLDMPPIQQAVTWQDGRPVCFAHYELSET